METTHSRRNRWLLWSVAVFLLIALLLYPASYRVTRAAIVFLALITWCGPILLLRHRPALQLSLILVTGVIASFLSPRSVSDVSTEALREKYLSSLRSYEGVTYHWGGENARGIDCSGLVRRGMMNAMFKEGVRTRNGGLVRDAIDLWWHDSSAKALGEGYRDLTTHVVNTRSLNELDHALVTPGDLAVTQSGVHILAYVGDRQWIQADPVAAKVITLPAPTENGWYQVPMKIMRWRVLE
jgi:hypothetical protein